MTEDERDSAQAAVVACLREAAQILEDAPTLENPWHLEQLAQQAGKTRDLIKMAVW